MKIFLNGIVKENPIFVLLLGLCSVLAVTTKLEQAYLMGIAVLVVLVFSNVIISLIRKLIPDNVKIPVFILIIGTFVTILELVIASCVPNLYKAFGIYLPLIAVSCIILGRALIFASKESVSKSFLDGLGMGLGFLISIALLGLIREILGSNSITLIDELSSLTGFKLKYIEVLPNMKIFPMSVLVSPAGAFLTLGLLVALFNKLKGENNESD